MPTETILPPLFHNRTRRHVLSLGLWSVGALSVHPALGLEKPGDGISRAAETIHQEPFFKASRKRVYDALTVTEQFDRVISLVEQDDGTKILFDHEAFPNGDAGHLASGWQENYWNPLTKFLA